MVTCIGGGSESPFFWNRSHLPIVWYGGVVNVINFTPPAHISQEQSQQHATLIPVDFTAGACVNPFSCPAAADAQEIGIHSKALIGNGYTPAGAKVFPTSTIWQKE